MNISLRDVLDIYCDVIDGLKQQLISGALVKTMSSFPRDPWVISQGVGAAFGFEVKVHLVDFYIGVGEEVIPDKRRDFYSFYRYSKPNRIDIFLNTGKLDGGQKILSSNLARFVLLKEMFIAVIRKTSIDKGNFYPDTIDTAAVYTSRLDYIVEKFSIYDFVGDEYAQTVKVENAAELLAIMFLVDIGVLYSARQALHIKPKEFWGLSDALIDLSPLNHEAETQLAFFDYEGYARMYGLGSRTVMVLIKSDIVLKIVDSLRSIKTDLDDYFINVRYSIYEYLDHKLRGWLRSSELTISESGRAELNTVFSQIKVSGDQIDRDRAEAGMIELMKNAATRTNNGMIGRRSIRDALITLCPLYPFC